MLLSSLELIHFRNHLKTTIQFSPLTMVVGQNAKGKTNILEAVFLLATGESFRAQKIEEMVHWDEEVAHVIGEMAENQLHVTLTKGVVQGKRTQKRLYKINGVGRRKQDVVGMLPAVLFSPEDMDLVGGEPSLRRAFLDTVLVQADKDYRASLLSYQKGLKQRNRLLDQIREGRTTPAALYFWNQLLVKEGEVLNAKRQELVEKINTIDSGLKRLRLGYSPSILTLEKLAAHLDAEIALGYTLSGPHKDDVKLYDGERDLAAYGSRGEQRMVVLWLKKAQLTVMEEAVGVRPILLLDDILSELDHHHIEEVVLMAKEQQTVLTTTDEGLSDYFGDKYSVVRLGEND